MNGDGIKRYWDVAQRRGLSLRAAARAAGLDGSVLCRALKGSWAGDVGRVEAACERALEVMEGGGVIDTTVVRGCRTTCSAVAIAREIGIIWGPLQCGKTTALRDYVRSNPDACYVRVSSRSDLPILAEDMARSLGCERPETATFRDNRRGILDRAAGRVIIVDELHEAFTTHGFDAAVSYIEFLREVHDRTGCALALCGTDALPRGFRDKRYAPVLRQTWERGIVRKTFPALPPWRDVEAAARFVGVDDDLDANALAALQSALKGMSFGAVCRVVRAARNMSDRRGRPMKWARITEALRELDQFAAAE